MFEDEEFSDGFMRLCENYASFKSTAALSELTDKIYNFVAPKILGDNSGKSSFDFRTVYDINESAEFELVDVIKFLPDVLLILKKKS